MVWGAIAALALLWPARSIGLFDGVPLDTRAEALVIGLGIPMLLWFDRSIFDRRAIRGIVVVLFALKLASGFALTQEGFCTEFRADRPIVGQVQAIEFDDPAGDLPSWDLRTLPGRACSAITARAYASRSDFPAWFINLVDNVDPTPPHVAMRSTGVIANKAAGTFAVLTTPEMKAHVTVDGRPLEPRAADRHEVALDAGVHHVAIEAALTAPAWKFVTSWNGSSLSPSMVTVATPTLADALAPWFAVAIRVLTILLMSAWIVKAVAGSGLNAIEWTWIAAASVVLAGLARTRFDRPAVLLLFLVLLLPTVSRRANVRGASLVLGIPWLALFAASSLDRIGAFSIYTRGNDWLTYQISAYRIYRFGAWLEAGERMFYYQPLYRWIAGSLHLVFGDSSVGETYWDAAWLFAGALVALHLGKTVGRRWAVAAAAATLAIATLGPIWYLIGRGLAEITAAGFTSAAALCLIRGRHGHRLSAFVAGVFAVLAYYSRLNHMLFAGGLLALLLPSRLPSTVLRRPSALLSRIRFQSVGIYVTTLGAGLVLLATRTWYYGGRFSVFQGTSLALNFTGFEPGKTIHSVFTSLIANESFDVRGLPILVGVAVALLAVLQVPRFSALLVGAALTCLSGVAGAFIAHAHGYPGRFSVHLLPFASAMTAAGLSLAAGWFSPRPDLFAAPKGAPDVLVSTSAADKAR